MQPVMDAQGRIAGFLTWDKVHPMMRAMQRLLPFIIGIPLVLVGFAGFSLWQLRRARHELAASEEQARRAADEDKLTGLPNHAKTLELLDLALAERAGDDVTTFALIELDGMADVRRASRRARQRRADRRGGAGGCSKRCRRAVCGRIGSDEFAVAFTAGGDVDAGAIMPRRARGDRARRIGSKPWCGSAPHAGFAQAPRHGTTRGELTRRAELALRAAAKKGAGRHRRLRARDRHRVHRSEVHPARIAARADRQRTGAALSADRRRRRRRASSASRRCCAGRIRPAGRSRHRSSFRSPSRAA